MTGHAKPNLLYLLKGSAQYGASDIFSAVVRFFLVAVYSRILAPADFGAYAIITSTLMLVVVVVPLGLPYAIMVSFKSDDPAQRETLKNTTFSLLLFLSAAAGLLFYAGSQVFFKHELVARLAPWLIVQCVSEMLSTVPKASLRFNHNIALFSAARVLRIAIMVAALFAFLAFHKTGLEAVVMAEAFAAAVECVLCCVFDRFKPSFVLQGNSTPLFLLGMPLTIIALGLFCNDLADRYVVYLFLGEQANGYYAAAAKIAVLGSFFAEAFNAMWFPYYLRFVQREGFRPGDVADISEKLVLLFALLVSFLGICLPQIVAFRVFGRYFISPQYHPVSVLVAPLILVYFFKMCLYIATPIMTFQNRLYRLSLIIGTAAVLNIVTNIVWTRLLSASGTFTALTVIAFMTSVSYGLCMVWVSKEARLFSLRSWIVSPRAYFSAALLGLAVLPVPYLYRLVIWLICAGFLYWRYFSKSNVPMRLFSK
jgi:O-antigen/teichoic acid export membrane protein